MVLIKNWWYNFPVTKKTKPATSKEIADIKKMLTTARNHYENELLKIEKVWAGLKPADYARRTSLVKTMSAMAEIDQSLRVWEDKLD